MARMMIADDSDVIRLVLKDILSIGEHEIVVEATDGAEAVEFYQKHNPDILLLDLAMPKKRWSNCSQKSYCSRSKCKNNFDYCK